MNISHRYTSSRISFSFYVTDNLSIGIDIYDPKRTPSPYVSCMFTTYFAVEVLAGEPFDYFIAWWHSGIFDNHVALCTVGRPIIFKSRESAEIVIAKLREFTNHVKTIKEIPFS